MGHLLITDYLNESADNLLDSLSRQGVNITDILYIFKSDYKLNKKVFHSALDSFYDHSYDDEISKFAINSYRRLCKDNSEILKTGHFQLLKYIDIIFISKIIELLKVFVSLKNFTSRKDISQITIFNLKSDIANSLVFLTDIPISNSKAKNAVKHQTNFLNKLLYKFFILPKNFFIRILNTTLLRKRIILMISKNKSGKLYKVILNNGYHLLTLGALIPFWDNIYMGGETVKISDSKVSSAQSLLDKMVVHNYRFEGRELSKLVTIIVRSFKNIFNQCIYLHNLLSNRHDIHFVHINCDPQGYAGLAQDWAFSNKIPVSILQHGLFTTPINLHNYRARCIFAWGEHTKEWLIENSVEEKRIFVTGCPAYKSNFTNIKNRHKPIVQNVLVALSWYEFSETWLRLGLNYNLNYTLVSTLLKALKNFPDLGFFIKLHPRQSDYELENFKMISKCNTENKISVFRDEPLDGLFDNSQLCFCDFSTTGLEAIMNGSIFIRTAYYVSDAEKINTPYKGVPVVYNEAETVKLIASLLNEKNYKKLLDQEIESYKNHVKNEGIQACDNILSILKA